MFLLPFRIDEEQYSVMCVLGDENIERIKKHDPAEVTTAKLGKPWSELTLKDVIITWASEEEEKRVMQLCQRGQARDAMLLLTRGFRYRPDLGDNPEYKHILKQSGEH